MGAMKDLWIRMEQERAEREMDRLEEKGRAMHHLMTEGETTMAAGSPDFVGRDGIGRDWKVVKTFQTDCDGSRQGRFIVDEIDRIVSEQLAGVARQVRMTEWEEFQRQYKLAAAQAGQSVLQGLSPTANDRVSNCIHDIELHKKARLTCPKCHQTDWRYMVLNDDPPVRDKDAVGNAQIMCVKDQGSVQFGGANACGYRGKLYDFMDPSEHDFLRRGVKDWMFQKGYSPATVPPAPSGPGMQAYNVLYVRHGEQFKCRILMPILPPGQQHSLNEMEKECEKLYAQAIDAYWAGLAPDLPKGCEMTNPRPPGLAHWLQATTPPPQQQKCTGGPSCTCSNCAAAYLRFKSAVKKLRPPPPPGGYDDEDDYNPSEAELAADHRAQHPTCEADKPEGTRDVEKFQKEQQDELWRRMME